MDKSKIAEIVDDSWRYSLHWKEYGWQEQALSDCKERMTAVKKELKDLEKAYDYLQKFKYEMLMDNE